MQGRIILYSAVKKNQNKKTKQQQQQQQQLNNNCGTFLSPVAGEYLSKCHSNSKKPPQP